MSDFYIGEIRLFGFPKAPTGWALCNGAILQITQNQALYSLIGKTYGGDGQTTFALPDLRGRIPVGVVPQSNPPGSPYGGVEGVALTINQIPPHNHDFIVNNSKGTVNEPNDILAIPTATNATFDIYNTSASPSATLTPETIQSEGGGAAHDNMQPFLTLNYCIAVTGFYPTRP